MEDEPIIVGTVCNCDQCLAIRNPNIVYWPCEPIQQDDYAQT